MVWFTRSRTKLSSVFFLASLFPCSYFLVLECTYFRNLVLMDALKTRSASVPLRRDEWRWPWRHETRWRFRLPGLVLYSSVDSLCRV